MKNMTIAKHAFFDVNILGDYLPLAGGIMTGNITMNDNNILFTTGWLGRGANCLSFNAANDGIFANPVQFPVGAALTPAVAVGVANIGLYSSFGNLDFATGGIARMSLSATFLRGSGNDDFSIDLANSSRTNPAYAFRNHEGDGLGSNAGGNECSLIANSLEKLRVDITAVAGDTALMLWDVNGAAMVRVTVGANDSGGAGFKVLRIPN